MEQNQITLLLDSEDVGVAQELGQKSEVDLQTQPKKELVDGLSAVLIAGGVLAIAKFVFDFIDRIRGGVVIQIESDGKVSIRRDKALPLGWAAVETARGTVSIEVHDMSKDSAERVLAGIVEGALKTPDEIVDLAKKLGAKFLTGKPEPAK
jgi:hypothetical protein